MLLGDFYLVLKVIRSHHEEMFTNEYGVINLRQVHPLNCQIY
jgi:hypothetical protein